MQMLQVFLGDMGVNLGGCDIHMTEHHLNGAQVSAPFEQVAGKGMPQGVQAPAAFESGPLLDRVVDLARGGPGAMVLTAKAAATPVGAAFSPR